MSAIDLPLATRITLANLRRVNAQVVLVAFVVVLVVWAAGLSSQAHDQARREADRIEHQQRVAQRVDALAADWRTEQSFLVASRRSATRAQLSAVTAERATVLADRDVALTSAAAVLATSAGRVDDRQRTELQAAVDVLSAPETVH